MGRSSSTTGIGVRNETARLGNISTQPIPFVIPTGTPVVRQTSLVDAVIAPGGIASALIEGQVPQLTIPVNSIVNGTMQEAVSDLLPTSLTRLQYQPSAENTAIRTIAASLTTPRRPNDETLSIGQMTVLNREFQPTEIQGISKLRPELIAVTNFEPLFVDNSFSLNDFGILFDIQYQARVLRAQTFLRLLDRVQRTDQNQELQAIQRDFFSGLQKINSTAEFYQNTITTLEIGKTNFDPRSIPPSNYDIENFKSLGDYYEVFMAFPRTAYESFSGTKVMLQFISDLRNIAEGYSMNLLNLVDPDRQAGGLAITSPITIDKSYNTRSGFSFKYDIIRSYSQPDNAADGQFFARFNNSLPASPDDRIKLLVNILSKELRVSRGLGRDVVIANLRQKFNAATTNGSPFDNLFGGVGNTIFDTVTGPASIASLIVINDVAGSAVLPFEKKYIDTANTKKTYIPGSSFFIDSIVNVDNATNFNLTPLREYVTSFSTTVDNVSSVVANIFDFGDYVSPISSLETYKLFLQTISNGLTNLLESTQRSGLQLNIADAAMVATFRLAITDQSLKKMLFHYFLLSLLNRSNSRFFSRNTASDLLQNITQLDTVEILPGASAPDLSNVNSIVPYLSALAVKIQNKVVELINQQNNRGGNAQTRDRHNVGINGIMRLGFDTDTTYGIPAALNQNHFMSGLVNLTFGLEAILGNEFSNCFDALKKTRFNSFSTTTLLLLMFEIYSNLIARYVKVDFETSSVGQQFPDMIVDTNYNNLTFNSIDAVLSEPGIGFSILTPNTATNFIPIAGQQNPRNRRNATTQHVYDQVGNAAKQTGTNESDVYHGVAENEAILSGQKGTAGSRNTSGAQLANRNVKTNSNPEDLIDAYAIERSIDSTATKLYEEDLIMASGIHVLITIKQRLRSTLELLTNYFNQQTLVNFSNTNGTSLRDIARNLNESQVRLILKQKNSYVKNAIENNKLQLIPGISLNSNTQNALLSLLRKTEYREAQEANVHFRLFSVGIPSGFSKNLANRLTANAITNKSFKVNKQFDLIYVNVYKRSIEYPQLIFKPQKYLFDLSIFSNGYDNIGIKSSENFDNILKRITLSDYQTLGSVTSISRENIVTNQTYPTELSISARRSLFDNHVLSDLFCHYIQALTSMNLSETSFVDITSETWQRLSIGDGNTVTPRFANIIRRYLINQRNEDIRLNPSLKPLPDISIEEMLISPNVDQGTKDILKTLIGGNLVLKPENVISEMLSPKLFERVFTIPVNIDNFEIDFEKTTAKEGGRQLMEKKFFAEKLLVNNGIYKLRPRSSKDIIFEDYFVTIELVG